VRVYIAAPWDEREVARGVAAQVASKGHTITHNWWDHDVPEQDEAGMRRCAEDDVFAVIGADVFLLLNSQKRGEETSGKAVETGLALVRGCQILAVGEKSNVFHFLPAFRWFNNVEEAIAAIGG
jgi:hypothetical protein